jgi:hypothetical protein
MASGLSIGAPYVVASLPKLIDASQGRYVVGEVYGGAPNSKKRKRSELAVGTDGEGINIYDVRRQLKTLHCADQCEGLFLKACYVLRPSTTIVLHMRSN